jgi:YHS domain-containing protein
MEGLISLLFYAVLFYLMMRFGCGAHMVHGHHHNEKIPHETEIFIDPVCGKVVADNEGYGELVNDKLFRFCSRECLDEFDQHKQEYSKKPNKVISHKEHQHEA